MDPDPSPRPGAPTLPRCGGRGAGTRLDRKARSSSWRHDDHGEGDDALRAVAERVPVRNAHLAGTLQCAIRTAGVVIAAQSRRPGRPTTRCRSSGESSEGLLVREAGMSQESQRRSHSEPAALLSVVDGWVGGGAAHRERPPGSCPRREAQFVNLDKDPMDPPSGGLGERTGPGGAGQGAGRGREARFVNPDKDPMDRRAVGLGERTGPGGAGQGAGRGREARFVNPDKDPMDRRAVGLGERRGARGCRSGSWTGARDAIRESRQRPYGPPSGGLGREDGRRGVPVREPDRGERYDS